MQITESTKAIVRATAPVLAVHGLTITQTFYKRLFEAHPALKNVFNMTHQETGVQPRSLAGAVYAYAAHIDDLSVLAAAVENIAQKHASVQVKAEHYPIVGEFLLKAIKEVLQDAATDQILQAWAEAYQFLADIFIKREVQIYKEIEQKTGGFDGYKAFTITKKVKESSVVTSFYFTPQDAGQVPTFKEGQYLTIKTQVPGQTHTTLRNYTISDASGKGYLRISVKREADNDPKGIVSNYLHDFANEGDHFELAAPFGPFFFQNNKRSVLFLSAGVGITPMMSMLQGLSKNGFEGKEVLFVHANRNPQAHAFVEEVAQIKAQMSNLHTAYFYEQNAGDSAKQGRIGLSELEALLAGKAETFDAYICGPSAFITAMTAHLNQLSCGNIYTELFHSTPY